MPSKDKQVKNQTNLKYYYKNRDKVLEKIKQDSKKRYRDNPQLFLERTKRSIERNFEAHLLTLIKSRCKKENIPFNLELSDISIPEVCPLLKCKLTRIQGQGRVWTNASVDRIDPTKGYIKGNIQVLSQKANLMKAHSTQEELLQFAKSVLEIYKE